jgi:hypothetical protein
VLRGPDVADRQMRVILAKQQDDSAATVDIIDRSRGSAGT